MAVSLGGSETWAVAATRECRSSAVNDECEEEMTVADSKPVVQVTVVSGPTSEGTTADWELFFARRALAQLTFRLGRQGLLDLLKPDTDSGSEQLSRWAASSDGKWQPALTEIDVTGSPPQPPPPPAAE